jgi:hypothetical protein
VIPEDFQQTIWVYWEPNETYPGTHQKRSLDLLAPHRRVTLLPQGPSYTLSRDLMASHRKQCRLVTRLLSGHCALRWHRYVMGLLKSVTCMKCGQEDE